MTAIVIFVYNRKQHLERTVEALEKNDTALSLPLVIYSDGPRGEQDLKKVNEVRTYLRTINKFQSISIVEQRENLGLARSVILGVTETLKKYSSAIILEDDIECDPHTIEFFLQALEKYRDNRKVFSISANSQTKMPLKLKHHYPFDVFFTQRMMCWGWATWRDRWDKNDWDKGKVEALISDAKQVKNYRAQVGEDSFQRLKSWNNGKIDAWACRWIFGHYAQNAYSIVPIKSLTKNIGLDGSGTNCGIAILDGIDRQSHDREAADSVFRFPQLKDYNQEIDRMFVNSFQLSQSKRLVKKVRKFVKKLRRFWNRTIFPVNSQYRMERLGSDYGGWWIPIDHVDKLSSVVSAGAGEDISFDLALSNRHECFIDIFDSTPRALAHFKSIQNDSSKKNIERIHYSELQSYPIDLETLSRLTFHQNGIWKINSVQNFYTPKVATHVSHSIGNLHDTDDYFEAQCLTLDQIMEDLGFDRIDLLKMDIEGAEFAVIRTMLYRSNKKLPKLILVEFHAGKSRIEKVLKFKTLIHVWMLRFAGYSLIARRGWDFVFIRLKP